MKTKLYGVCKASGACVCGLCGNIKFGAMPESNYKPNLTLRDLTRSKFKPVKYPCNHRITKTKSADLPIKRIKEGYVLQCQKCTKVKLSTI